MDKIYLDNSATTQIDEEVLASMIPYFKESFANANSGYTFARDSAYAVGNARRAVASFLGCHSDEIFFTSSGSESNNWAIKGIAFTHKCKKIIVSAIEHPSIINACKWLEGEGYEIVYLKPDESGYISPECLESVMSDDVSLVSIMTVNNEIGVVQPIKELARVAHKYGAYFHTDAVQAVGYENISVKDSEVDLLTVSAHKFYGPKGIGALYIRKATKIDKLIHGGHQELSMRGGTTNVPSVVGFATALGKIEAEGIIKVNALRQRFESGLLQSIDGVIINGGKNRSAHISSVTIDGVKASMLLIQLDCEGVCCSAGSACSSGSLEPSHVLEAIGLSQDRAMSTLRFSFGKYNTEEEIDKAVRIIAETVARMRNSINAIKIIDNSQNV